MTVTRTINGATAKYIEVMEPPFDFEDDVADAWFVDSGLQYDGVAATEISGLDHLEGEQVQILADGAVRGVQSVAGGKVTLKTSAEKVQVGFACPAKITTLPLVPTPPGVDPRGKHRRVYKAMVQLHRSVGGFIGVDDGTMDQIIFRRAGDPMDTAVPLFTGLKEMGSMPTSYERLPQITFRQDDPLPSTILNLILEMDVGGV